MTANGAAVLDFSKVTPVAFGSSQSASAPHSLNDQVIIRFDTSLDRGIAHTYSGSGLSDVVTLATGAAAISDTISGGAGNDVFKMILGPRNATTDHLAGSAASFTDVLSGGSGTTDNLEITLGETASTLTIANTLDWSNLSGIEVLSIAANDAAATPVAAGAADISITPAATAFTTAGLRQITLAIDLNPAGTNTINASAQASTSVGLTLTGGAGVDQITGGAGNDVITGGAGADIISVGSGGTDRVVQAAAGESGSFALAGAGSVSTTGFDIVSGLGSGDSIALAAFTGTAASAAAASVLVNAIAAASTVATGGFTLADNASVFVRGTYTGGTTNTFVGSATGADALLVYDGNATLATTAFEAVVLVGVGSLTATVNAGTGGVITLS